MLLAYGQWLDCYLFIYLFIYYLIYPEKERVVPKGNACTRGAPQENIN